LYLSLHAAAQARWLLAPTAAGLPSPTESHPMDHDSISSGHTLTPYSDLNGHEAGNGGHSQGSA